MDFAEPKTNSDESIFTESEIPKDPWIHRSSRMKCKTCIYYMPKLSTLPGTGIGRCRRHSPTMSGYPVVFLTDWCGDHKLNENKTR